MNETYGEKIVDNYGILTADGLNTLVLHGNVLISAENFDKALRTIARKKFKKVRRNIFVTRPEKLTVNKREFYYMCVKEAMLDCARRSGYSSCRFRILEKESDGDKVCIIIERSDGGRIGWQ